MVFGIILSMFIVEYYNRIMIQFFLGITLWSLTVDIIWFLVNGKFFIEESAFDGIVGIGIGNEARSLSFYFYFVASLISIIFIGKIILSLILLMEIQINEINDIEIHLTNNLNLCLKPLPV